MQIIYADSWIIRQCILFLTLQVVGSSSVFLNQEELSQGVCDGEMLNASIHVTCEFRGARAKIRGGNEITHCENRICVKGGQFSGKDNILNVFFPMDYKSHIDNVLEVSVTCSNGRVFEYDLHMVPCLSQFNHSVGCNRTHVQITCEHNSYNLSKHGMTIKNLTTRNMLVTCRRQEKSQECIPNGAQLILPYVYGQEIQCEMDGQFLNINITSNQVNCTDDQTSGQLGHSYKVLPFGCFLLPLLALLLPQCNC
ncbi:uncharacterized protein LOC134259313 isoform X1 [Saccostrea cucullata]|uniref:uncharacterized protein LOC134259313 isoform X1 n=2 Tax=Saccostrea cuccullata TaxID=36930 RepID=UPI002ED28E29